MTLETSHSSQNFKKLNIWGNEEKRKGIGDAKNQRFCKVKYGLL